MQAMADRLTAAFGLPAWLAAGLAAPAAALLLVGCGSSSTPSASTSATTSSSAAAATARFVVQAQAVCRALNTGEKPLKTRQEALKGEQTAASEQAFVVIARQVVTLSRAADGKLAALARPPADAHAIEKLLTSFAQEIVDVNDIANAAANQESTTGEGAEETLRKSVADNSALAAKYGMKDCIGAE
jgi:hypothetical protein